MALPAALWKYLTDPILFRSFSEGSRIVYGVDSISSRKGGRLVQRLDQLRLVDQALFGYQLFSETDYRHYRSITAAAVQDVQVLRSRWSRMTYLKYVQSGRDLKQVMEYLWDKLISTVESMLSSGSVSQLDSFKCRCLGSVLTRYTMYLNENWILTTFPSNKHVFLDITRNMEELSESFNDILKMSRSKRDHPGLRFGVLLKLFLIYVMICRPSEDRLGIFCKSPFGRYIGVDGVRELKMGKRLSQMARMRLSKMEKRRLSEMIELEYLVDSFPNVPTVERPGYQLIWLSFAPSLAGSLYPNRISNSTLGSAQADRSDGEDCVPKWNTVSVLDNPAQQYLQGERHHGSGSEVRRRFKGGIRRYGLAMKSEESHLIANSPEEANRTNPEEVANSPATVLAVKADETSGQFSEPEPDKHEGSGSPNEAESKCEESSEGDSTCHDTGSQHAGQKRPWAAMDGECSDLLTTLAPFIKKQVEDALLPLLYVLRSREEGEQKHRETLLALEKERLALEREKSLALEKERLALEKDRLALEREKWLFKRQRVSERVSLRAPSQCTSPSTSNSGCSGCE